jgi:hypothetical protein
MLVIVTEFELKLNVWMRGRRTDDRGKEDSFHLLIDKEEHTKIIECVSDLKS